MVVVISSGILLLDKPSGITSHDAVARTRRAANTRKVGHAGTLDPMATGLLVLGVGSSTRLLTFVVGLDKEYLATIRLGASTSTDDREGEISSIADPGRLAGIGDSRIGAELHALTGRIDQVPSAVSAIKVDGQRAYARVRAGEPVELASRSVEVSAFELLDTRRTPEHIDLDVRVECSSGTYIRALARDIGGALGVGGHLTALRRTRVGPFEVADAAALDDLDVGAALIPAVDVARRLFPVIELAARHAIDLGHGKKLQLDGAEDTGPVAAVSPQGALIGLVQVSEGRARSLVNFPPDEAAVSRS